MTIEETVINNGGNQTPDKTSDKWAGGIRIEERLNEECKIVK